MQLLQNRYGKAENLIATYMNAIINMKHPTADAQSLRNFHDKLETHIRCLKSLGEINTINNTMLVSIIKQKLSREVQTQMYRESSTGTFDVTQLMQALLKETNAKCCGSIAERTPPAEHDYATASFIVNNNRTRQHENQNRFVKTQRKLASVYCKQEH